MPIPTVIGDLSTTASLNSPAGSENLSTTDDYLRAVQGIVKTVYNDQVTINGTIAAKANLTTNTFTGVQTLASGAALNTSISTLASSATPDIWTNTSNVIDYTGTVTATGFATAPQAGVARTLILASTASFTAGTNMLIDGVVSFTGAAGDEVEVFAVTTTQFRLRPKLASGTAIAASALQNYLTGLTLSTAGASTTVSIAAGQAANSTNAALMSLAASIAKTTAAWAVGTAAGGLDTGTIANATWYYWYLIRRPDTGVVDLACSLSSSAPTFGVNIPAAYTQFRYIGGTLTNGTAQWLKFIQQGDLFLWDLPVLDFTGAGSTTAVLTTISAPRGRKVEARFNAFFQTSGNVLLSDPDTADNAPSVTVAPLNSGVIDGVAGVVSAAMLFCRTNSSAQIRRRSSNTNSYALATLGWVDLREKI